MNTLALLIGLALAGAAQAAAPGAPWLGEVRPPLLLALAVHHALTRPRGAAAVAGALAGLVQDAMGRIPLGCSVLAFGAAALLVGRFRENVFQSAGLTRAVFGAAAAAGVTAALWAMLAAAGDVRLSAAQGMLKIVSAAALGLAATPLVGRAAGALDRALGLAPAEGRRV